MKLIDADQLNSHIVLYDGKFHRMVFQKDIDQLAEHRKGGYNMLNVIENVNACGIIRKIRENIWNYDIPSPTVPEYVEHHEQMQKLLKICDDALDQIDQLTFWVDESEVQ